MPLHLQLPLIYLITSGNATVKTTPATDDFLSILKLVEAAVAAKINLLQIREKNLTAAVLYELASRASKITKGSQTKLLVNDRSDIARAAGADGVHLTTHSILADVIRNTFGELFLIGVSTHSLEEAVEAKANRADFVVYGPVYQTDSKKNYGEPLGFERLKSVASRLKPFPVLALGGVTLSNLSDCFHAGAKGVAAIRMLNEPSRLEQLVKEIQREFGELN